MHVTKIKRFILTLFVIFCITYVSPIGVVAGESAIDVSMASLKTLGLDDESNQLAYDIMSCVISHEESVDISKYNISTDNVSYLNKLYFDIKTEAWNLWYISGGYSYHYNKDEGIITTFIPKYMDSQENIILKQSQIDSAVSNIIRYINNYGDISNAKKVALLYDYFCKNYKYSYSEDYNNVYDFFINYSGKCMSMSQGLKTVCYQLQIPCRLVVSADGSHEWDEVYVNDNWYVVDIAYQKRTSSYITSLI